MTGSGPPDGVDPETVERAMRRVLQAEKDRLHMDSPLGINNEIEAVLREEVE